METEISGRLLITGDLHGDTAALTMITRQLREGDALFVAGDFGFVFWDNRDEHVFLDDIDRFLQKINGYIIFADGNHENHRALNKFPVEQWNNARVHMIRSRMQKYPSSVVRTVRNQTSFKQNSPQTSTEQFS